MKIIHYISAAFILASLMSCAKDPVKEFSRDSATVYFNASYNAFSLIGKSGDEIELTIPVNLVGTVEDYDRAIDFIIEDSTAVQDKDYRIVKSQVDAGSKSGSIVIAVKQLDDDVDALFTKFTINPNKYFPETYSSRRSAVIGWSASYARPKQTVWRYWHLFFSTGYSKNYHKLMVEQFGTDIELYTNSKGYAAADSELIYKLPTWWYSASREFREMVRAHDAANPDSPYMHSDDYESYDNYFVPVGEGTKPDKTPTILETLKNM